jgi:hypothetical protein
VELLLLIDLKTQADAEALGLIPGACGDHKLVILAFRRIPYGALLSGMTGIVVYSLGFAKSSSLLCPLGMSGTLFIVFNTGSTYLISRKNYLLAVLQRILPKLMMFERVSIPNDNSAISGPRPSNVQSSLIVHEANLPLLITPHSTEDDDIELPALYAIDSICMAIHQIEIRELFGLSGIWRKKCDGHGVLGHCRSLLSTRTRVWRGLKQSDNIFRQLHLTLVLF